YLSVVPPKGSMYAFVQATGAAVRNGFDDQQFALDLLEKKRVLVAPGSSFNVPYKDRFRVTLLPDARQMQDVMGSMHELLAEYADASDQLPAPRSQSRHQPALLRSSTGSGRPAARACSRSTENSSAQLRSPSGSTSVCRTCHTAPSSRTARCLGLRAAGSSNSS